jgi:hypothetical protein
MLAKDFKMRRRSLLMLAMISAVLMVACNKPEAPPPPKVEAPTPVAPAVDEKTKRLAAEVYVYAYPIVLMDLTRYAQTAKVPTNTFAHKRSVPDVATADVAYPNADFLYSQAWLDLSKGPVILSVPDTKGRYYLIAMLDAWTNVAASLGKRTTGTEKIEFAIVGPKWKGTLPGGVSEVKSPTDMAWLFGRIEINGRADVAAAAKIQNQYNLRPLSAPGKGSAKAAAIAAGADSKSDPREQIARMDAAKFFTHFAMLLPANPPAKEDAAMVEKMRTLGIVAGQPFDPGKLEPLSAKGIEAGAKSALEAIETAARRPGAGADIRNGWLIERDLGRWGTDYGKRALNAWKGLGANAPEDAIFMMAQFDGGGHRLDGANRYVLHFDSGRAPPADGFWSLSLYDDKQHFVANALDRYNVGSRDKLGFNADGSLDIYIQSKDPGQDKTSNWLPAPAGAFNLILRVYAPKQDVVDGRWVAPGIRRAT